MNADISEETQPATASRGFALLLNILDVQVDTPLEIIPGHTLRRPSGSELNRIIPALDAFGTALPYRMFFECLPGSGGTARRSDNPEDWRYWVIEIGADHCGAVNEGLVGLQEAARLTPIELDCGVQFYGDAKWTLHSLKGANPFQKLIFHATPQTLDEVAVSQIQEVYKGIRALSPDFKPIKRAIGTYYRLLAIHRDYPLYTLGVFSVIESLLTHHPEGGYDSLGHQIKTKMGLLDRRFREPLTTSQFGKCSFETLWSKLYDFRSRIAHGRDSDFGNKDQVLRNMRTVADFLDSAAKALLRHALIEPELIRDLQDC